MSEEHKVVETRQAPQKEVQVTAVSGKFHKNEVSVRYLGLDRANPVEESIIKEVETILTKLEKINPQPQPQEKKTEQKKNTLDTTKDG